jgi:hypothetical protein
MNRITSEFLRTLTILALCFAISYTQFFVHKNTRGEKFILIAISLLCFATIPLVCRIWTIPGKKELSMKRWALFFIVLVVGLVTINFHLATQWFESHPRLDEELGRLNSAGDGWFLRVVIILIGLVIILIRLFRRERKSSDNRDQI